MALSTFAHRLHESASAVDEAEQIPLIVESDTPVHEDASGALASPNTGVEVHVGHSKGRNWISHNMHGHLEKTYGMRYLRRDKEKSKDIYHAPDADKGAEAAKFLTKRGQPAGVTASVDPLPRPPKVADHGADAVKESAKSNYNPYGPQHPTTPSKPLTEGRKVEGRRGGALWVPPVKAAPIVERVKPQTKEAAKALRESTVKAINEGTAKTVRWVDPVTAIVVEGRVLRIDDVRSIGKVVTALHPDNRQSIRLSVRDLA